MEQFDELGVVAARAGGVAHGSCGGRCAGVAAQSVIGVAQRGFETFERLARPPELQQQQPERLMRAHADRAGAQRIVRFGGLFHFGRLLHLGQGLAVAIERTIAPSGRHLELNCDLSCPVEVLRVRERLLQRRELLL